MGLASPPNRLRSSTVTLDARRRDGELVRYLAALRPHPAEEVTDPAHTAAGLPAGIARRVDVDLSGHRSGRAGPPLAQPRSPWMVWVDALVGLVEGAACYRFTYCNLREAVAISPWLGEDMRTLSTTATALGGSIEAGTRCGVS